MKKAVKKQVANQQGNARKALIEDLFQDFNNSAGQVYKLNFIRGIFFGLGSALGGTVVLALVIWLLALFTDLFPGLNYLLESLNQAADKTPN
jgi:hypothetical protein